MATSYFAKVGPDNRVIEVIAAAQDVVDARPGDWTWVRTWYLAGGDPQKRYKYAGIGDIYDASAGPDGAFYVEQPYPSWTLNAAYRWEPPTPYPDDDQPYVWNEDSLTWKETN